MHAPLRLAIAQLRAAGLEITKVVEATRHIEVHIAGGGVIRIHRGSRVASRHAQPALRAAIRKLARTGATPRGAP